MRLETTFEDWTSYALRRKLLQRDVDLDLLASRSIRKIVGITGMRRSGKSSVLMSLAQRLDGSGKRVAYVNMEDQAIIGAQDPWDQLLAWFGDQEGWLLLDEVTSAPGWSGWLAKAHELHKDQVHLVVSSSRSGLTLPPKELRGRLLLTEVFPLSFPEYVRFKGEKLERTSVGRSRAGAMLDDYLRWGGMPEVVLQEDETERKALLNAYYRDILGLDVALAVRYEMAEVEMIGRYLLRSPYFSAGRCLAYLQSVGFRTSKEKLLVLEGLLRESYLFHFSPIFSFGIKDRGQYPRKCLPGDNGFLGAIVGDVSEGRMWEAAVHQSMRSGLPIGEELCYWKDARGREVDVVEREGDVIHVAVQVCSDMREERTKRREIDALVRCTAQLRARRSVLIGDEEWTKEIEGATVEAIPLLDWLTGQARGSQPMNEGPVE